VVTAARKSERLGTGLDDALQFVDNTIIDEEILMAERNAALRAAFAELTPRCQRLLAMLTSDPPCSYAEISATLQIPVGSIGPQRARCLERMRKSSALSGLGEADLHWAGGEHCA
jgi:DNA-directed RNA polymerase specialized sigma24 family protein